MKHSHQRDIICLGMRLSRRRFRQFTTTSSSWSRTGFFIHLWAALHKNLKRRPSIHAVLWRSAFRHLYRVPTDHRIQSLLAVSRVGAIQHVPCTLGEFIKVLRTTHYITRSTGEVFSCFEISNCQRFLRF